MTTAPPVLPTPGDTPDAGTPEATAQRILEASRAGAWGEVHEAIEGLRQSGVQASTSETDDAAFVAVLQSALGAGHLSGEALDAALGVLPLPVPLAAAAAAEPGERVLWVGAGDRADDDLGGGDMLRTGEVGVLTGAGGLGKSAIALDAMICADAAARAGLNHVELGCGLCVTAGRVLLAGYEDSPARIGTNAVAIASALATGFTVALAPESERSELQRTADMAIGEVLAGAGPWAHHGGPLYQPLTMPLFAPPQGAPSGVPVAQPSYRALLERVDQEQASLLVLDPVTAAYGASPNDAVSVRQFIAMLTADARRLGIAILLLAHSTKTGRRAAGAMDAAQRGAEAIAGSGQWYDASRAVLLLEPEQSPATPPKDAAELQDYEHAEEQRMRTRRQLTLTKTNYGPAGWTRRLGLRRTTAGTFAGWAVSMPPRF